MSKFDRLSDEKIALYWELDSNIKKSTSYLNKGDFENVLWLLEESVDFTKEIINELKEKEVE